MFRIEMQLLQYPFGFPCATFYDQRFSLFENEETHHSWVKIGGCAKMDHQKINSIHVSRETTQATY